MRFSRALRTAAWGAVAVGVGAQLARHRLGLRPPVVSVLSFQAPIALALATRRTPLRDAGIYALQMWAYYAHYDMPDDDPERLRARTRIDYPIAIDRKIGLGEAPTTRLQRALGSSDGLRAHDIVLSMVHWAWFAMPHASLAWILVRHRDRFPRSAATMAATFDLGLVVYWALPTAPPWYAGQQGRLPPVRRIMLEAGDRVWGRVWKPLYDMFEGNPFAAMPSLHFGTSVMAARLLWDIGRVPGALGWTYALTLGFGLVYLGEHYVIDLIAGFALTEVVRRGAPMLGPSLLGVGRAIGRLEPGTC